MRMSAKAEYAVRAMTQLAAEPPGILIKTDDLAKAQGIPAQFLVDILSALRADRLVRSQRGRDGGYELARPADQISIADVVRAVDDPSQDLAQDGPDPSAALWRRMNAVMLDHMAGINLASLVQEQVEQGAVLATRTPVAAQPPRPAVKKLRLTVPNSVFAFGRSFAS